MFELSLLIFVIACCHLIYKLITRLCSRHKSLIPFFIPTTHDLNLAWGFTFYAAAFSLLSHTALHRDIFAFLAAALFIGALFLHFCRSFFCGGVCPIDGLYKQILQKRLTVLPIQFQTIPPPNAAALLGIPLQGLSRETLKKQYDTILSALQKRRFLSPDLQKLLTIASDTLQATLPPEK